ncbi:MAG: hypothetical protein V1772_05150 [Chloroflexota bacterium]
MTRGAARFLLGLAVGGLLAYGWGRQRAASARRRIANGRARVLVVGSGALARAYAVQCARAGLRVTLLDAAGCLPAEPWVPVSYREGPTSLRRSALVPVCHRLPPASDPDLVIVAALGDELASALRALAALNDRVPLLLLAHASAPVAAARAALGTRALLVGLPATAGYWDDGAVLAPPLWAGVLTLGETDGAATQRLHLAASLLRRAGLRVRTVTDIAAQLAYQDVELAALSDVVRRHGSLRAALADPVAQADYHAALENGYDRLEQGGTPVPRALRAATAGGYWTLPLLRLALAVPGLAEAVSTGLEAHLLSAYVAGVAGEAGLRPAPTRAPADSVGGGLRPAPTPHTAGHDA